MMMMMMLTHPTVGRRRQSARHGCGAVAFCYLSCYFLAITLRVKKHATGPLSLYLTARITTLPCKIKKFQTVKEF